MIISKSQIKRILPRWLSFMILYSIYIIKFTINKIVYKGKNCYCPVCNSDINTYLTDEDGIGICPICGSGERHRVDWLFINKKTNFLNKGKLKKMLHVAPEFCLINCFKQNSNLDYVSIDLEDSRAMHKMDITNIEFPDNYFDIIYCSHVMEHVINDRKAISEFYRVLKTEGWALLQVPITSDQTFEDFTIITSEERNKVFGHEGHVRRCGLDYGDRMRAAGFTTTVYLASDVMTIDEFKRMGIFKTDRYIIYCTKD